MKENSYYGFHIEELTMLNTFIVCEGLHFDIGHHFTIKSFPYKTIKEKKVRFVYGIDIIGNNIRCEINQIVKL